MLKMICPCCLIAIGQLENPVPFYTAALFFCHLHTWLDFSLAHFSLVTRSPLVVYVLPRETGSQYQSHISIPHLWSKSGLSFLYSSCFLSEKLLILYDNGEVGRATVLPHFLSPREW